MRMGVICMCTCLGWAYIHVPRGLRSTWGVFFNLSPLNFWACIWSSPIWQASRILLCLPPQYWSGLLSGFWVSNACPHVWEASTSLKKPSISPSLFNVFLCTHLTNENQKRFRCVKTSTINQNSNETLIFIHSAANCFDATAWCECLGALIITAQDFIDLIATGTHCSWQESETSSKAPPTSVADSTAFHISQQGRLASSGETLLSAFPEGLTGQQNWIALPEHKNTIAPNAKSLNTPGHFLWPTACNEIFSITFLFEKFLQVTTLQ